MGQLVEIIWATGILLVVAFGGVTNQEKYARLTHLDVCLAGQTVTIWEDQWEECFRRYPLPLRPYVIRNGYQGPLCGPCGKQILSCPDKPQDATCVAIEGTLP